MRLLLATPLIVLGKATAFLAGLISGRPITLDIPYTLDEAIAEGIISEADAKKLMAEIESEDDSIY